MNNTVPGTSGFWLRWLVVLLVGFLTGCAIDDLPRRVFPPCGKPAAQIVSTAQLLAVTFKLDTMGTIDGATWNFGDGRSETALSARHVFDAPGTYKVSVTLTNKCGDVVTVSRDVIVDNTVLPIVSTLGYTLGYSEPTGLMATVRMVVESKGNGKIAQYGICYSDMQGLPTILNSLTVGIGSDVAVASPTSFTLALQPGKVYYFTGFATNTAGTGYGGVLSFVSSSLPSVLTVGDTLVGTTTAGVIFRPTGPGDPPATKYGICYSATSNVPTLNTAGSQVAEIASPTIGVSTRLTLTNLQPKTLYYYRAFATSALGTVYSSNTRSFTTQTDIDLTTGLVGLFSFNGNGNDGSGNLNNGTLKGGAGYSTDRNGNANAALQLDGVSGYFDIPDAPSLRPASLSISVWVKPTSLTRLMQIYNKSNFTDGSGEQYSSLMLPAVGNSVTVNVDVKKGGNCEVGKGWQTSTFTSGLTLNNWHHIVSVFDGNTGRLYFDGVLLTTKTILSGGIDDCAGGSLKFGAQYKGFDNYFDGAIDDIRIYNRPLTDVQVRALSLQ